MTWKSKKEAVEKAESAAPAVVTNKASTGGSSSGYKPKRVTVLDIRVVDTKNGKKPKVQFSKDIEVYFQGQKLDMGEYNSAFLKTKDEMMADIDFLVEKEFITEAQAQDKADFIDDKNITSQLVIAL